MRAYREQDYDQMATRVVDRFMTGEKLADVAAMEAQSGQLNPDQIERLVHSANTMAFLRLMEQQKAQGSPDMTGEFDPIDARQVMQQLMQQTDVPHMDAPPPAPHEGMSDDAMPLPNEMGAQHAPPSFGEGEAMDAAGDDGGPKAPPIDDDNDGPFPKGDKQKAKDDSDKKEKSKKEPPKDAKKDTPKEAAFRSRRMHKLTEMLEDQLKQAELAFDDAFAILQNELRRAHGAPSAASFEKDALALHGDDIGIVILGMVQEGRGWPVTPPSEAHTKTAGLADRHLVDDTHVNKMFTMLVKIATEAARLKEGAEYARSQCS